MKLTKEMIRNVALLAVLSTSCTSKPVSVPLEPVQAVDGGLSAQQAWEKRVQARIQCEGGEARVSWPNKEVVFACPDYTMTKEGVAPRDRATTCHAVQWSCTWPTTKVVVE